jgi:predicted Zn-dependent peptidase
MNLREDKGYTYGAGSRVSFGRGVGRFVAYAALQRAFSAPGLEEFFAELGRLEDEPISPDELERVKSGLVRSLPGDFERIGDLAGAAAQIFAYQLPLDHYAQLASRLSEVELEAVREAAGRYLEPEVMQVLMVGDAKTVVPALEAMDLGEVRMLTP